MKVLITGGAGFIGVNTAKRYIDKNAEVIIIDNLSRKGTNINLNWIKKHGKIKFYKIDIRDFESLNKILKKEKCIDVVFHFAAQVAVTTSVVDPRNDFEINAIGTFNLLEAIRKNSPKSIVIFSSTNKVYGGLEQLKISEKSTRYELQEFKKGIPENFPMDFHSPYGCSKGTADQYVRDYSRIYGLKTVVFRQSCIYGQHQFGIEDQGWVAHFAIQSLFNRPITIYGNGKQVRDVLYVDDLIDAFELAIKNIKKTKGQIYNIGGGYKNQISLLEFISLLEKKLNKKIKLNFSDWRPGDQKIFVSDNTKLEKELNWRPKINIEKGLNLLIKWIEENKHILEKL